MKKKKMEISDAVGLTPSSIKLDEQRLREVKATMQRKTQDSAKKCDDFLQLIAKSKSKKESEDIVIDAWNCQMTISDFSKVSMAHSEKWVTKIPQLPKRKNQFTNQPTKENHGNQSNHQS